MKTGRCRRRMCMHTTATDRKNHLCRFFSSEFGLTDAPVIVAMIDVSAISHIEPIKQSLLTLVRSVHRSTLFGLVVFDSDVAFYSLKADKPTYHVLRPDHPESVLDFTGLIMPGDFLVPVIWLRMSDEQLIDGSPYTDSTECRQHHHCHKLHRPDHVHVCMIFLLNAPLLP